MLSTISTNPSSIYHEILEQCDNIVGTCSAINETHNMFSYVESIATAAVSEKVWFGSSAVFSNNPHSVVPFKTNSTDRLAESNQNGCVCVCVCSSVYKLLCALCVSVEQ